MKFEHTEVWGFAHAMRGARNALESWDKSDSKYCGAYTRCEDCPLDSGICNALTDFVIGENDMKLAKRLIAAGDPSHCKFRRQIMVSVDITAPMVWFSQFDTYKIGTVANSTSKMHTIAKHPITADNFELTGFGDTYMKFFFNDAIEKLEAIRIMYLQFKENGETYKAQEAWRALIAALPESWLQTRTVTMNYENLANMYHQRKHHKLKEWSEDFCNWVESLPYAQDLIIGE